MKEQEWFKNWFDSPYYSILYDHRNDNEAQTFIDNLIHFLLQNALITENSTWLDTACGTGRHAIYLAKKGFHVTGIDLSPNSIKQAIQNSQNISNIQFLVQDIRKPLNQQFEVVSNLFTSFGYFENDPDNVKVIQNLILQSKNLIILDYLNAEHVIKSLVPQEKIQKNGITFYITREIVNQTVVKTIYFQDKSTSYTYYEQVKLYTASELVSIFKSFDTHIIAQWGDYNLNSEGNRCILLAQKNDLL